MGPFLCYEAKRNDGFWKNLVTKMFIGLDRWIIRIRRPKQINGFIVVYEESISLHYESIQNQIFIAFLLL